MEEKMRRVLSAVLESGAAFVKWLGLACLVGVVAGLAGAAFWHVLTGARRAFAAVSWLLYLLPLSGAVIALAYGRLDPEQKLSTNLILQAARDNRAVPLRTAPLIFAGTALTHLCGGSAGREGAALQLGGSLATGLGRLLRLKEKDGRMVILCGMSAAFAAVFGTPLTAAIFALEVASVGVMHYAALVPCTVSALIGFLLAGQLGCEAEALTLQGVPALSPASLARVAVLALLCAVLSVLFCRLLRLSGRWYARLIAQPVLRAAVGGAVVVMVTLLLGTRAYNGAGMDVVARALEGESEPLAFLFKMLLTALTLGAGFRGGEIVPLFFIGSTFGCVAGDWLGLSPSFAAGIGLVALFCGATNCPITSLMLGIELFGGEGMALFLLACAVSYALSGYTGLYTGQKILDSKQKLERIDRSVT